MWKDKSTNELEPSFSLKRMKTQVKRSSKEEEAEPEWSKRRKFEESTKVDMKREKLSAKLSNRLTIELDPETSKMNLPEREEDQH